MNIPILGKFLRYAARYLVPSFVVSAYFFLRYRAIVSTRASVQLTSKIIFGKGTVVKPYAIVQVTTGRIIFGKNCAISNFNHIHTGAKDLIVGNNVRLGPQVVILGSTRNFRDKRTPVVDQGYTHKGVKIGNDVLVGAGAIILNGCSVGEGAVIGAASLVSRDVPPYSVAAGVPAKVIGQRE